MRTGVAGTAAREVVRRHEAAIPPERRRRLGAHSTPEALARRLAGLALDELDGVPRRVLDPACGAGSFLLAVADELVARGVPAADVPARLHGADVDGGAVAAATEALARWAADRGVTGAPGPTFVVADTLLDPPPSWPGSFDLVVANPPFLGQLAADTARDARARRRLAARFGEVGAYTDTAGLFLVAATGWCAPGGVAVVVQPQSLLGARDAGPVRAALLGGADLVALWADDRRHFDAHVRVCAPVLHSRAGTGAQPAHAAAPTERPTDPVRVWWGDDPPRDVPGPAGDAGWGALLASAAGIPLVPPPSATAGTVGDLAEVTAGFRDEFYALAGAAREPGEPGWAATGPRLVTVGMVDPLALRWGSGRFRLAGRSVTAPRLDRAALAAASPGVAGWASRRLRPKLVVATQTRVLEAVVDPDGDLVPVTPAISVEPGDPDALWPLAAALLAPPVAAAAAADLLGTGRSAGAVRWSARRVREVPLPVDAAAWGAATEALRAVPREGPGRPAALRDAGAAMCRAHAVDPAGALLDWWCDRVGA